MKEIEREKESGEGSSQMQVPQTSWKCFLSQNINLAVSDWLRGEIHMGTLRSHKKSK